jgi:hypothetical protein
MKPEIHTSCSWEVDSMGEWENWTSTLSNELPLWKLDFRWTLKSSESNWRGQNPSYWGIPYIIGNLLERKYLKWARTTHLDIWNTSYGQKNAHESNCQIDSWPLKVGNRPDFLGWRGSATYHWNFFNEGYNFFSDLISIRGLHTKLWPHKVVGVSILRISGLSLGSPETKCHLDVGPMAKHKVYYKGEGGGFLQVWVVVSLVSLSSPMACPSTKSVPTMR